MSIRIAKLITGFVTITWANLLVSFLIGDRLYVGWSWIAAAFGLTAAIVTYTRMRHSSTDPALAHTWAFLKFGLAVLGVLVGGFGLILLSIAKSGTL